jgi:hypothetical protein
MKKFLAVYLGSPNSPSAARWNALSEAEQKKQQQAGITAWGNWVGANEKFIVENGGPLGKTKQINLEGVSDTKNQMTAYTIVEAEDHAAAAKMFLNHPHFTIFPGDSIEVMECLPIPGM